MRKGLLSILAVASMIAILLAGCGINNTEDSKVKTFKFYNADGQDDPWTDPVALKITELSGVKLETDYPVDGDDRRISLMIASNGYPDLIYAKGDTVDLIDSGALIDLSALIEEYGPNIKKLYGDNLLRLKYSEDDPSIYTLGTYGVGAEKFSTDGPLQLQYAVLKEAGYPIVRTLEQYEKLIKDYKANHPKIIGPDGKGYNTIGMTLSTSDWHWYITLSNPSGFVCGYPDNGQWIVNDETCEATYKHAAARQYEYYKWLNHLYNEGLLDPEFATQTHDDYLAKIATGRVLGIADASWNYNVAEATLEAAGLYERTYAPLPVTLNENIKCALLQDQGYSGGWGVGITTACEDPVGAIKFLDWICSEEAQILVHWGIEGINYEIGEDGMRYIPPEEISFKATDSDYAKKTGVGFHSYPFPEYGDGRKDSKGDYFTTFMPKTIKDGYHAEELAALNAWGVELLKDIFPQAYEFPVSKFGTAWQTAVPTDSMLNEFITQADELSWQYLVNCTVAPAEEFDALWQEFQDALKAIGLEDANREMTQLLTRKAAFWSK